MPEVLEIEVDGQPIDEAPRSGRSTPRWGFPAAIAVAGLLAIAVLAIVFVPALTSRLEGPEATAPSPRAGATPATAATLPDVDERVDWAEAALEAWGEFAVTGQVDVLEDTFDMAGPQYRDLAEQSGTINAAPPGAPAYEVTLDDPTINEISSDEVVVTGTVIWARAGEVDQRYQWEIILRREPDARWLLWTVRSTS